MECVEFLLYNYWVLSWYRLTSGYTAHLYRLLSIGRIAWYKFLSSYTAHLYSLLSIGRIAWYKLSSGYAAHLYSLLSIGRIAWYKFLSGYAAHLSPWKGEIERGLLTYLCSIIVALAIFSPLHLFTLSSFSCLQIVSFHVVKKSEGTSRECQRNCSTCSWLVKTQGFYDRVCYW